MGLPGRKSLEIVSGEKGSQAVTLRLVEIPVPKPGDTPRGPHFHKGFEECIYVMSGEGCTEADSGKHPAESGRHHPDSVRREARDAQHRQGAAGAAVLLPGGRYLKTHRRAKSVNDESRNNR